MQISEIPVLVKEFRKNKIWWTLDDIAEFLEVTKRTAWEMVRRGDIEAIKIGNEWKIHYQWVIKYLQKNHSYNID